MPNYYNPYQYSQNFFPQQQVQPQMQAQPQIQNGGFIPVRGEQEARRYPVAPGTSITFKDEIAPYVYTKTMGFSSLDRPVFDKFRLVKEEPDQEYPNLPQNETKSNEPINLSDYVKKSEFESITKELEVLKKELSDLKESLGEGDKNDE